MSDDNIDYAAIGRALIGDGWSQPAGFRLALPSGERRAPAPAMPEGAIELASADGDLLSAVAATLGHQRQVAGKAKAAEPPPEPEEKPKSAYVLEMERLAEQRTKLDAIAAKLRKLAAESTSEPAPGPYDAAIARVQRDLQFKERRRQVKAENKAARAILKAQRSGGAR